MSSMNQKCKNRYDSTVDYDKVQSIINSQNIFILS